MKVYPVKENFFKIFKGKERVLENLFVKNSFQLKSVCEDINVESFILSFIKFNDMENYTIDGNVIHYIHPITKEESHCVIQKNYFHVSNLLGFDFFIKRYFVYSYVHVNYGKKNYWLSFLL